MVLQNFQEIQTRATRTASAAQVEANLQEQLSDHLHFRKPKCCQNARYLKQFHIFALASHCFQVTKISYMSLFVR